MYRSVGQESMAHKDRDTLRELPAFKRKLHGWARDRLQRDNPGYVQAFSQRFAETGDLSGAIEDTRSLLGAPPAWYELLTAMAETEMVLDQLGRAIWFLATAPAAEADQLSDPGAWAVYHLDHWMFEAYALMEAMNKLIKRTVRHLVRPHNAQWRDVEKRLVAGLNKKKNDVAKVRDALAHGAGSGVTGIADERLWEPYLVLGFTREGEVGVVEARYQSIHRQGYQQRWYEGLRGGTASVIATMEDAFTDLSREAFGNP